MHVVICNFFMPFLHTASKPSKKDLSLRYDHCSFPQISQSLKWICFRHLFTWMILEGGFFFLSLFGFFLVNQWCYYAPSSCSFNVKGLEGSMTCQSPFALNANAESFKSCFRLASYWLFSSVQGCKLFKVTCWMFKQIHFTWMSSCEAMPGLIQITADITLLWAHWIIL